MVHVAETARELTLIYICFYKIALSSLRLMKTGIGITIQIVKEPDTIPSNMELVIFDLLSCSGLTLT
jgi:hypothetical protein